MRGKVYYITYKEDVPKIQHLKEEAISHGNCYKRTDGSSLCGNPHHALLELGLWHYYEGFFGWF
jgi:hypothetical protein